MAVIVRPAMKCSRSLSLALAAMFGLACAVSAQDSSGSGAAQSALPTINLEQALSEAAASGADMDLVTRNLGVARLQRSLDLAKQGISLAASGAYTAADGLGDVATASNASQQSTLTSRAEAAATGSSSLSSYLGIAQSASGGLSLSTPLTKLSLSASQSFAPSSSASTATVIPTTSLGLTASQTLWDGYPGGQYKATLEKSAITLSGKELSAAQGKSSAVSKVKQSYAVMLAAQRDLVVKRQVLDKQSKLLAQVQATFALKQASAIDLKTAEINAKSADIDVRTADKALRLANERLAVIMGRKPGERFAVAEVPDPALPAASIDEAISIGLGKRTDLAQAGLSARSSRIDAALARAQGQPAVSLTGGTGLALGGGSTSLTEGAFSLGAKISLPIIDSGAAELQAKTSEGQASAYELQADQLKKTIASDIRDYFESAQLLAEKIDLAKSSADLAEAQFELVKAQNQYGTATTQDMLTASVTAATAEVNYGTARNSYLLAELSLETAMGL
jgi:Outer membrane protein